MGTTDVDGEVLVTSEEAAEILGVSLATIYRRVAGGELEKRPYPGIRGHLITLNSIDDYRLSRGMTVQDLSSLVLKLQRRVEELESKLGDEVKVKKNRPVDTHHDVDAVVALLNKKHSHATQRLVPPA